MQAVAAKQHSVRSWWHDRSWVTVCVSICALGLLLGADVLGGTGVRLGSVIVAVPPLTAVFASPAAVTAIAAAALPVYAISITINGRLTWTEAPVSLIAAAVISAAAIRASQLRERREHQLEQSRQVTALTQQIVLRPLPSRLGPLEIASSYIASDEESTIGGDLYAGTLVDGRPRVIIGDVQGKGLPAVEMVMYLLIAFREAAKRRVPLDDLPVYLDEALRESLRTALEAFGDDDGEQDRRSREGFVTAAIVEAAKDGGEIRMATCGHPPPLLFRDGTATQLYPSAPAPPLGLLPLGDGYVHIDEHRFLPGDTLLLYTDGLIEARNPSGQFYPIEQRAGQLSDFPPAAILDALEEDLRRHTRMRLEDDVAMVTLRHPLD
jgi:serine phosphatase RsbU (regulator of sigma subunit)